MQGGFHTSLRLLLAEIVVFVFYESDPILAHFLLLKTKQARAGMPVSIRGIKKTALPNLNRLRESGPLRRLVSRVTAWFSAGAT
jgi:hypothetical protein